MRVARLVLLVLLVSELVTAPVHAQWLLVTSGNGTDCVDQVQTYLTSESQTFVTETGAVAGARTFADLSANFDFVYLAVSTCGPGGGGGATDAVLGDATLQSSINGGALQQWIEAGGIMVVNGAHNVAANFPGPAGASTYGFAGSGTTSESPTITDANHDYIAGTYSSANVLTNADFAGWGTTVHGQVGPPGSFASSGGVNLGTSPVTGQYNVILTSAAGSSGVTNAMIEYTPGSGYVLLDLMTYDWGSRPPNEALTQQIDYLLGIAGNFPSGATSADLSVEKTTETTLVYPGETITYTIDVTNNGPDAAANVEMTDVLPPYTTFVSVTEPGDFSCTTPAVGAAGTVICTAATLADGATATFTLVIRLDEDAPSGTSVANEASVSSDTADSDAGNSTGSAPAVLAVIAEVPTASQWGLLTILLALSAAAVLRLR